MKGHPVWFKVDDKLWGHPKWLGLSPRARALWVTAGSWCGGQETDGRVPSHVLGALGGRRRDAMELVERGLWEADGDDFAFHDWTTFQPSREEQDAKREQARERMRRAREGRGAGQVISFADRSREHVANERVTSREVRLTRPDPTRPDLIESAPVADDTAPGTLLDIPGADAPRTRRKPERPLPDTWKPNAAAWEDGTSRHIDVEREAISFRLHAATHDRRARDWDAAFRQWLSKARPTPPAADTGRKSPWDIK